MWIGNFTINSFFFLFLQAAFIQNVLLYNFLGICSFIACSNKTHLAKGLGIAVLVVTTSTGIINWFVHNFITKKGALIWISPTLKNINLEFLEILIFISVIAFFVQILEIILDKYFEKLYNSLGIFLPLIAVNCAILGISLFASIREYPFFANAIFSFGSGFGWLFVIIIMAAIREKLNTYSDIISPLKGAGIVFIIASLMSLAFMAFLGMKI